MEIKFEPLVTKTVSRKPPDTDYNKDLATISVEQNKIVFSKDAIKALNVSTGDRIAINYWTVNSEETFPLIGNSELFSTGDGNRLTKSNTMSFRGAQKDILLRYGAFFKLEPFKNFFKLVKIEDTTTCTLEEEENDLKNLDI